MEALKVTPQVISKKIFNNLLKNVECDTGNDKEDIGFSSKWMNYEIGFYINDGDEDTILIDDFGFMKNGSWTQCEPTSFQREKMKEILVKKLNEIYEQEIQEGIEAQELEEDRREYNKDPYAYYGVNRAMFI